MQFRSLSFAALSAAALFLCPQAMAADPVGSVERVVMYAYGTLPSQDRQPIFRFDQIYFGERLETVENGSLKVSFLDNTNLFLGSKSSLVIDGYVYDPGKAQQSLAIKMGTGAFRFVTGKIAMESVKIQTPVAQIGIRGTDFLVGVLDTGKSVIAVNSGSVGIATATTTAVANAGDVVSIGADGSVTMNAFSETPTDIGLTDSGTADGNVSGGGDAASGASSGEGDH